MSSISLKNLSMSVFGESHGELIGGVITGLPAGFKIDRDNLKKDMQRRKPGGRGSTPRDEKDETEIVSGVIDNVTTGAPLTVIIRNSNKKSSDYGELKDIVRPSHSDYTAFLKYKGYNDVRGGGHFSGRLTAPLNAMGNICKQILKENNIDIVAHIYNVGEIKDKPFCNASREELYELISSGKKTILPIEEEIYERVEKASREKNSLGGSVECAVINMKEGIGGPFFEGVEGNLSKLLFAIPAVKGVEFGEGFGFAYDNGISANDQYEIKDGKIRTITNNNGGIIGGITNGENIILRAGFKPTPSVFAPQKTVNIKTMEETVLEIKGRHDPIIALRAIPVVENITAFGILDMIL